MKPFEDQIFISFQSISSTYSPSEQKSVTNTNKTISVPQKCIICFKNDENTLLEIDELLKRRRKRSAVDSDVSKIGQSDNVIKSDVWNRTRRCTNQGKIRKQQSHVMEDRFLTFHTSFLCVMFLVSQILLTFYRIRTVEQHL